MTQTQTNTSTNFGQCHLNRLESDETGIMLSDVEEDFDEDFSSQKRGFTKTQHKKEFQDHDLIRLRSDPISLNSNSFSGFDLSRRNSPSQIEHIGYSKKDANLSVKKKSYMYYGSTRAMREVSGLDHLDGEILAREGIHPVGAC